MNRHRRRLTAWIACFAILLASLAPAVSHALAAAGKGGFSLWAEICSAEGPRLQNVESHAAHDTAPTEHGMHFEHCPFCLTHAGSVALPSSAEPILLLPAGSPVQPLLFFHAPRPLFAWVAAQPRAPPLAA
jgi:hypothetical protein